MKISERVEKETLVLTVEGRMDHEGAEVFPSLEEALKPEAWPTTI
jgi:hypothetical protein